MPNATMAKWIGDVGSSPTRVIFLPSISFFAEISIFLVDGGLFSRVYK